MKTIFKPLSLTVLFAVTAIGSALPGAASAGTNPDGHGGAVCKGFGSCLVLELDCKGTYTDATQPDGTVYGKCDQVKLVTKRPLKLRAN
jgi:hypothetical protein